MKPKNLIMMCISIFLFASCNSDESGTEVLQSPVNFSSSISITPTKATNTIDNKWEGNESIGVSMFYLGSSTIADFAENKKYSTSSPGATTSFTSTTPIYYPENPTIKVEFFAYSPYDPSLNNFIYMINLQNQNNQSALDLLLAKANNIGLGFDKNNKEVVNLIFKHKLSKLLLYVKTDEASTNLEGLEVKIKGMSTKAQYLLLNQKFQNESEVKTIVPTQKAGVYEAILLPTTLGAEQVVEFTIGGNTYTWILANDITSKSLEAGTKYSYEITIKKTGVTISGTIEDWNNITGVGEAN